MAASEKQLAHLQKLAESRKGKPSPISEEGRARISAANKGKLAGENNPMKNPESRKKLSESLKGREITWADKISASKTGSVLSEEHKKNIGLGGRGKRTGDKCNFWRGGVAKPNKLLRERADYKEWRNLVFIRDNYTCVLCGTKGGIEAHHIKSFSQFPELRYDVNNGMTLCIECHKQTDNYGWKGSIHD